MFPPTASVSTYNNLLMALDHSECSTAWEIAMELVKNMARKPVVLPDTSLNSLTLFLLAVLFVAYSYIQHAIEIVQACQWLFSTNCSCHLSRDASPRHRLVLSLPAMVGMDTHPL